ncbi:cytochrome-c peroxidase [Lysobacter humi (ex Lee et al. 2017)]
MKARRSLYPVLLACPILLAGASASRPSTPLWTADELATINSLRLDKLPAPPPDPSNRYADDPAAAALGRALFFDKRLSSNGLVACASCHDPGRGFQDGRPVGVGVGTGKRRSMPVADAVYSPWLFWDGRKDSLWSQALGPLEDAAEHGGTRVGLVRLLAKYYSDAYEGVFGPLPEMANIPTEAGPLGTPAQRTAWAALDPATKEVVNRAYANMGKAIAAFERTVTHKPSRFDRYALTAKQRGPVGESALTPSEIAGLRVFIGRGQCVTCHNGPLLTDSSFHNTGVPAAGGAPADRGRADVLGKIKADEFSCIGRYSDADPNECQELAFLTDEDPSMEGAFKTPGLRGVADRPPYMHAGQIASLRGVIAHYVAAPKAATGQSELLSRGHGLRRARIRLSERDIADLEAFLGALSPEPN